jgi:hypothetical protein
MVSLPFSPRELVATDGCIVFDKHIHLCYVRNEALPPMFHHRVPSHGWQQLFFRERMTDHTWDKLVLPFMCSTKVRQLFCLAHLIRLQTFRQASNHCSLFPPIVHPKRFCLHGCFQRRSHPTLSRVPSPNHPHMILGSLQYSLPKEGYPFLQRPPQVMKSDIADCLVHLLLEVFPVCIAAVPLQL